MKKSGLIKAILSAILVLALVGVSFSQEENGKLKLIGNGDVIFIKNKKTNGNSLLPNGKTNFNYVGVVFVEDGVKMVYHATEPVSKCRLDEFIAMSEGNDYKIKRLYDASVLTDDVIKTMHTFAKAKLGNHYDNKLNLNNEDLYNAEFVYKMYQSGLGIMLVQPKPLSEYKTDSGSLEFLKEAYGNEILTEKMIVIGDIYNSKYMLEDE